MMMVMMMMMMKPSNNHQHGLSGSVKLSDPSMSQTLKHKESSKELKYYTTTLIGFGSTSDLLGIQYQLRTRRLGTVFRRQADAICCPGNQVHRFRFPDPCRELDFPRRLTPRFRMLFPLQFINGGRIGGGEFHRYSRLWLNTKWQTSTNMSCGRHK
jgi:hypothetical protein